MLNKNYFADDRAIDLSAFDGFTSQDFQDAIEYIENQENRRLEHCRNMTDSEQIKELEKS